MERKIDRKYRPTYAQWHWVTNYTEFTSNEEINPFSVELIDFEKSMVHLKGGRRVAFDCLSEDEFIKVCNDCDANATKYKEPKNPPRPKGDFPTA